MMLTLLLILFSKASFPAIPAQLECVEGKIRFLYKKEMHEEAAAYCFSENRSYFLSKECRSGKCVAMQKPLCKLPPISGKGGVGSPGFQLCHAAGGSAQVIEFFDGKAWLSMDRCFFAEDSSYVDTGIFLARRGDCPAPK